jgi:hypothetical protein
MNWINMQFRNLSPANLFLKKFSLNKTLIREDLGDDYAAYMELKSLFKGKRIDKKRIRVYHPGGGSDMLSLLVIYDALVSSKNKIADFVFVDMRDFFGGVLFQIKKYLPGARIRQINRKSCHYAQVSFKDKVFNIAYYVADISNFFPPELYKDIDIYYERAFEMFRSSDFIAMYNIYSNIRKKGIMITDHSFDFGSFSSKFKECKGIPKGFGLYQNFQIWQRTTGC